MKIGDELNGFRLQKISDVAELSAKTYEFEHIKTGAKLLYLAADDDNKVFYIGFRTPPKDDTGVAHIVEHSVLCGSRKYPLKEPFVELVKGSLNTFLNAMTYPDKTVYPVASRNAKDFRNLQDVYLDAVFYPAMLSTPEILMQEGWHYEPIWNEELGIRNDAGDTSNNSTFQIPNFKLQYSGVVFNEMKGALSSPDDILGSKIQHETFPQNCYGFESGGDPEAIPNLTQKDFIAFHQKFYHPSNSYIYLYGDIDIAEQLEYLDREYLSKFDKIVVDSEISLQPTFAEMKRVDEVYPIGDEESADAKTFLALNFMLGDVADVRTNRALAILSNALFSNSAAPVRKALIDSGLGKDVEVSLEDDLRQPTFTVVLTGSEKDRVEKFYSIVTDELQKLVENGIDKTLLQASLNSLEFNIREADFGVSPTGLIYGLRLLKTWLYDGDPNVYLHYEDDFAAFKRGINEKYFEGLIQKYFLDNPHKVLMTLSPDKNFSKQRDDAQAAKLAEVKANMSPAQIDEVIATAKKLKARQQAPETPEALATIPILQRSDLRKEPENLPLQFRDLDGTRILLSPLDTHGIIYLSFYFDALKIPQDKIFYAFLLSDLLGNVDTKKHSYEELAVLTQLHIGGCGSNVRAGSEKDKPNSFIPRMRVHFKALESKLAEMTDIIAETFNDTIFTNKKRVRELIEQEQLGFELSLQNMAISIVSSKIESYQNKAGAYNDKRYLPYNKFLKDLLANFDERFDELVAELNDAKERLLNRNGLIVSVTAPDALYKKFVPHLSRLLKSLTVEEFQRENYSFPCKPENEGLYTQSRVQYVGKGANFIELGYDYTGALSVLETILRYEFFWTKIRVQGGAYGAFAGFHRSGDLIFSSYRDPNLTKTLETFNSTADFIKNFDVSDREMDKYIIGTLSKSDRPLSPSLKGQIAADLCLMNITYDDRKKSRSEILSARQEDIRALAKLVEDCMSKNILCVFGNEQVLKEHAEIFGTVKQALE
ncbi:MAG: insulinase family protein [Selenomonadaceae bacterium]|nr:insulinase family protein [Selenomonadaceae bacterium]